jgi:hypothetical protein
VTIPNSAPTAIDAGDGWAGVGGSGDPAPLDARGNILLRWLGPAISISILIVVLFSLRTLHWRDVIAVMPTSVAFWAVFTAFYLAPIVSDWFIFRYLWRIPATGLFALTRKQVSNELLLGYLGEVYFYSWARNKLKMQTSPFGAVKDVAILSALAGNAVTLVMIIIAAPLMTQLEFSVISQKLHVSQTTLGISLGLVVVVPMLALLFGKRLFSLSRSQLFAVTAIHFARILITMALAALGWALALPQVALSWWIVLSTVRLIISRLPLVTQKDIVFAGIAIFMVGRDLEIAALIAFWAALQLIFNVTIGGALAAADFIIPESRK